MENEENAVLYSTASHKGVSLDNTSEEYEACASKENMDLAYNLRVLYRYLRKKIRSKSDKKNGINFKNILYLTLDCPPYTAYSLKKDSPLDYISEIKKQYPYNNFVVLIPIINIDPSQKNKKIFINLNGKRESLEKTNISFKFFLQNRVQKATIYKYPKNSSNIDVYGIYSPIFSRIKNISDFSKLHYLAPFVKSTRIAAKKLSRIFNTDLVHTNNIPYYLGTEFESNLCTHPKILEVIDDFTMIENSKTESFWAAINLADEKAMRKICRDEEIKKLIAELFNLHNTKRFYQMRECLNFIYKNYYKFRKYVDKGEDIEENVIFNNLNSRISELFPKLLYEDDKNFNTMVSSIKKSDSWATISKSYYEEIFSNINLSGKMYSLLEKTKEKSCYLSYGYNSNKFPKEETRSVYQGFNINNFRELRYKNKKSVLKEFSYDRIKTNFIDPTLFNDSEVKIYGSLDSFYEAPLFFANPNLDIFASGIDVLFNTILKLFELHKNIQIIICIKDGLKNNFIKQWIDFLSQNKQFDGRWVYVDGEINLPKFLSAADMFLIPQRVNSTNIEHLVAMNYGCIPVATRFGFLNDSIPDIFDDVANGCGFKTKNNFLTEEDPNELFVAAVLKALNLYQNSPSGWNLLIKNCINKNSDWNFEILEKYNKIYQDLIE